MLSTSIKRASLLLVGLCIVVAAVAFQTSTANDATQKPVPPTVVEHVDLDRYQGTWYEIASMPMFFQRNCAKDTQAHYKVLPNGQVSVLNECWNKSGKRIKAKGRAKVADPATNAKLKVTFLNLFGWRFFAGGDYWIIDLDPNYQMAIIGHPKRKYGWLLSRDPHASTEQLSHYIAALRDHDYDPCNFNVTLQTDGHPDIKVPKSPVRLCDVAKF